MTRYFWWYGGVWLVVIGLSISGSYFNALLTESPFHLTQELPFVSRWIVWIPLTPLAVYLARKMNFAENKVIGFAIYHFFIYLLLCTIHVFVASLTAKGINMLLGQSADYTVILRKCALTGLFFNFVVYSLLLLLINGIQYYRALQTEKVKTVLLERSLADQRLQFLKQQLQPHFLFNIHHSIITLIRLGERDKAAAMLEQLSELMRMALREADEHKVTLAREIENLKLYIGIQMVRYAGRMSVDYDIPPEAAQALVPGLILQPLIENSIRYLVERSPEPSLICIRAVAQDGRLALAIKDRTKNADVAGRGTGNYIKGTGLSNSEERLHRLFGPATEFSIGRYEDAEYCGTEVVMKLPIEYGNM